MNKYYFFNNSFNIIWLKSKGRHFPKVTHYSSGKSDSHPLSSDEICFKILSWRKTHLLALPEQLPYLAVLINRFSFPDRSWQNFWIQKQLLFNPTWYRAVEICGHFFTAGICPSVSDLESLRGKWCEMPWCWFYSHFNRHNYAIKLIGLYLAVICIWV